MPFLIKKIEFSIVEPFSGDVSVVTKLKCDIGYGGSFFQLPGFYCIIQNFDQVINVIKYPPMVYYGLRNKPYSEIKISY